MIADKSSSMNKPRAHHHLSFGKQLVFVILIASFVLGMMELGVRIWAHYFRTSYERYNSSTGRMELVPNIRHIGADGKEFLINSRGFVGPDFDEVPQQGIYRIISLGDSCTFTNGTWEIAYPAVLGRMLNTENSRSKYEVINAGIEGYNSTYALARLQEELLRYRPRLVTIYIGWNDLMKVDPMNASRTGAYAPLAEVLEASYLVKAYKKLIFAFLRPLLFQPRTAESKEDDEAFDNFVPLSFEKNLASMFQILKQNHVQVVVNTLPTVVKKGMTTDELKRRNVFFPYFANSYSISQFLSLHRAYNQTIRRVGEKYQVTIVDLDQIFNERNKGELFWDTMHPGEKGNRLIAESIFRTLQQNSSFEHTLLEENS